MGKLHGYAEQDFGVAFIFARELSQARDFKRLYSHSDRVS
jgi:hypothetical protein